MIPLNKRHSLIFRLQQINWAVVALVVLLAGFGFAMMVSAGGGDPMKWAVPQLVKFMVGFSLMLAIALTPIRIVHRYAYVIYFGCLLILIAVEVAGFMGKGAQRWVNVGIFNLQPSELMKVAIILVLARYFHNTHPEDVSRPIRLLPPLILLAFPAALILHQPNLGTTAVVVGIAGIMFFMAGVNMWYFVGIFVMALAAAPVGWHFLHDYQKQRVLTFLDPEQDPLGSGYNIMQSMIAIGSGGLFGKGYLQGSQGQLNFLPEKHTDFIFTMVAEEFGFIGSTCVLILYALLLALSIAIAIRSRNLFGSLLASGVAAMLFIHLFINVAMVMGMVPVVGLPLPLLSYGGTIMMTVLMAFGLLLNAYVNRDTVLPRGQMF